MPKSIPFGVALLSLVLPVAGVSTQSAAPRPSFDEFEVAIIKPTPPNPAGRWIRMLSANEFATKNYALKTLIAAAYNLNPQAILGEPSWVDSDHYDITARTPGHVRPDLNEQMSMLRKLLAERFRLAFHRDEKEMGVYALTVAKGGSKLKEVRFLLMRRPKDRRRSSSWFFPISFDCRPATLRWTNSRRSSSAPPSIYPYSIGPVFPADMISIWSSRLTKFSSAAP
jgi:Protein of unknown function (DUF3738)